MKLNFWPFKNEKKEEVIVENIEVKEETEEIDKFQELKKIINIALNRDEAVLVHKNVTTKKRDAVVDFVMNHPFCEFELLDAVELEKLTWEERNEAAKKPMVFIVNIDLESKEQEKVFSHFRSRKQNYRREEKGDICKQICIIRPGTNEKVTAWSSFFNWTNNI